MDGRMSMRPVNKARHNWEDKFKVMAEHGDDVLVDGYERIATTWDDEEWEWLANGRTAD